MCYMLHIIIIKLVCKKGIVNFNDIPSNQLEKSQFAYLTKA